MTEHFQIKRNSGWEDASQKSQEAAIPDAVKESDVEEVSNPPPLPVMPPKEMSDPQVHLRVEESPAPSSDPVSSSKGRDHVVMAVLVCIALMLAAILFGGVLFFLRTSQRGVESSSASPDQELISSSMPKTVPQEQKVKAPPPPPLTRGVEKVVAEEASSMSEKPIPKAPSDGLAKKASGATVSSVPAESSPPAEPVWAPTEKEWQQAEAAVDFAGVMKRGDMLVALIGRDMVSQGEIIAVPYKGHEYSFVVEEISEYELKLRPATEGAAEAGE